MPLLYFGQAFTLINTLALLPTLNILANRSNIITSAYTIVTVCCWTSTDIMNALPIARIEASILIGFSEVGYLVVLIACTLEAVNEHLKELQTKLFTKFLHTPEVSKPREWCPLLINQMISRDMWDIKRNNTLKIIPPSHHSLPWQTINQV